ncbi:unnamed protein product [Cyclocybe aegerita]|uniref:Uncharacterized protein n=1 Tax=Cyclocybe aegerita TaxID=1973307 RepID=A0A8S0W751_CYCAE|nr:unnamed protein product [Cyclocybe aegerita]
MHSDLPLALFVLLCSLSIVASIPTWEGMNGRSSIGSLIPGASNIRALGPAISQTMPQHLTVHVPGQLGNLTISPENVGPPLFFQTPPLFYINRNKLWLLVNETTVFPVNIRNMTGTHDLPMQLVLGKKTEGITYGSWRWQTTMLYYDVPGGRSNDGIYYLCRTESGLQNIFMTTVPSPTPPGCGITTLHSFIRAGMKDRRRTL